MILIDFNSIYIETKKYLVAEPVYDSTLDSINNAIQLAKEFGDEPDKAHVGKAFFNLFPIASQFQNEILPFMWPEEAKEWGIRVTAETQRR